MGEATFPTMNVWIGIRARVESLRWRLEPLTPQRLKSTVVITLPYFGCGSGGGVDALVRCRSLFDRSLHAEVSSNLYALLLEVSGAWMRTIGYFPNG